MQRQLHQRSAAFRNAIDECAALAKELFGISLEPVLWAAAAASPANEIAAFARAYASAALLADWGLKPNCVSGSGVGRIVAAVVAGAISTRDGVRAAADPRLLASGAIAQVEPLITLLSSRTRFADLEAGRRRKPALPIWRVCCVGFDRAGVRLVTAIGPAPASFHSNGKHEGKSSAKLTSVPLDTWSSLLDSLAALYVLGAPIDWQKFESLWGRRRVALPTYPFQHEDYWLETPSNSSTRNTALKEFHPLLGRRLYSSRFRDEIVFEAEFSTARLPLLKDHAFFSTVVVAATAMLEMARAAGQMLLNRTEALIEDLLIEQPLLIAEGKSCLVQTVLMPEGANGYSFAIMSAETEKLDGAVTWKRHCSGKLMPAVNPVEPVAEGEGLARLQERYHDSVEPDWVYRVSTEAGVAYGPTFRLMTAIRRGSEGTLAQLKIPTEFARDARQFGLHPGLLDSGFAGFRRLAASGRQRRLHAGGGRTLRIRAAGLQ